MHPIRKIISFTDSFKEISTNKNLTTIDIYKAVFSVDSLMEILLIQGYIINICDEMIALETNQAKKSFYKKEVKYKLESFFNNAINFNNNISDSSNIIGNDTKSSLNFALLDIDEEKLQEEYNEDIEKLDYISKLVEDIEDEEIKQIFTEIKSIKKQYKYGGKALIEDYSYNVLAKLFYVVKKIHKNKERIAEKTIKIINLIFDALDTIKKIKYISEYLIKIIQ